MAFATSEADSALTEIDEVNKILCGQTTNNKLTQ